MATCRRGHEMTEENTKIEKYGARRCRTCASLTRARRNAEGYSRAYYQKNKDRLREYSREYQSRNREKTRARIKRWHEKNKDRTRVRHRVLRLLEYGLTPDSFAAMVATQGGVCAICRRPQRAFASGPAKPLFVDHDHDTGATRGLLCDDCNGGLGRFGDNPTSLRAAADYIEKHKAAIAAKAV